MNDDKDLELTKEINDLNEIDKHLTDPALDIEQIQNEVKDMTETLDTVQETIENIDKVSEEVKDVKEKKKLKDKIKDKWKSFSKKKKIIIVISTILVLSLFVTLMLILCKDDDKKVEKPKRKDVIIEKDNYRYENGTLVLLDKNDKELGKYECKNEDENNCYVAYYEKDEIIDKPKIIDEEGNEIDERSPIVDNKYVFIYDNKEDVKDPILVLYDIKNKKELGEYGSVKYASLDYMIVKDKTGSYGTIKIENDELKDIIKFNYDNISAFNDQDHKYFIINNQGRNYLINDTEKSISKAISMGISNYNNKYLVALGEDKKYYLYDYNNKMIFDESFDYIELFDDFVVLVKDKKLYLNYYDGGKLIENGYTLSPKYDHYQRVVTVDSDKKTIDDYKPFDVVKNTTTITVTIDSQDYVLNLKEREISKTLEYINYFDGILYIYDNADKSNLIGEYKCANPNVLTSTSTTFENCFIASDVVKQDNDMTAFESSGMIPIINNRYIFIQDNPNAVSETNKNITLYDIVDKKIVSKYLTVNSNLNTKSDKPSFVIDSNVRIIAQTKSNKYGVLGIVDNKLSPIIPFNYTMIENIGNNYVAQDASGYSLFDKSGKELTKKINNKIRGYNAKYVKAKDSTSYNIYDYEGSKLTKNGYKYIELYDNYYVGVSSDNKLNIYSYSDPDNALIENPIQLNIDKYYGDGQIAFKVFITGTTANIQVFKDGSYLSSTESLVKKEATTTEVESEVEANG